MRTHSAASLLFACLVLFGASVSAQTSPTAPANPSATPAPVPAPRHTIDPSGKSSAELDEKFRALRRQRSEIIRRIDEIKTQLGTTRDGLQRKEERLQRLKEEIEIDGTRFMSAAESGPSMESAARDLEGVEKEIGDLQSKIAAMQTPPPALEDQLSELKARRQSIRNYIDQQGRRVEADKRRQEQQAARHKQLDEQHRTLNSDIEADRARAQRLVQELGDELIKQSVLEDDLNDLLKTETQRNDFKTKIALAFTALVFLVILGFFGLSWKDEMVRRAIFSGESGIQFLTLFSVVIAIILFGITGILESKELSALLGGLSGYILGRVSSTMQRQASLSTTTTTQTPIG